MKWSTVIFDWSGVLSDDRLPVYEANMLVLQEYGKKTISFTDWLSLSTQTPREFFKGQGINEDPQVLFKLYSSIYSKISKQGMHPKPYMNMQKTLQVLNQQGHTVCIISSHPSENLIKEAKMYGVENYFDVIIGNCIDKTFSLLELCSKLNVLPSMHDVVYIGDTIYDVQAAKRAHICAIGITTGYHTRDKLLQAQPEYIIDSLNSLLSLQ